MHIRMHQHGDGTSARHEWANGDSSVKRMNKNQHQRQGISTSIVPTTVSSVVLTDFDCQYFFRMLTMSPRIAPGGTRNTRQENFWPKIWSIIKHCFVVILDITETGFTRFRRMAERRGNLGEMSKEQAALIDAAPVFCWAAGLFTWMKFGRPSPIPGTPGRMFGHGSKPESFSCPRTTRGQRRYGEGRTVWHACR
jgi:hypothetical protein